MSNTRYARDKTLRLDVEDTRVLAEAVMGRIEVLTGVPDAFRDELLKLSESELRAEVGRLRSLLERLSD